MHDGLATVTQRTRCSPTANVCLSEKGGRPVAWRPSAHVILPTRGREAWLGRLPHVTGPGSRQGLQEIDFRLELNSESSLGSESRATCFLPEEPERGEAGPCREALRPGQQDQHAGSEGTSTAENQKPLGSRDSRVSPALPPHGHQTTLWVPKMGRLTTLSLSKCHPFQFKMHWAGPGCGIVD